MRTKIGKIQDVSVGMGGYQDAMLGISFTLGSDGWGVGDFWGYWGGTRSQNAEWTEETRTKSLGEVFLKIERLLVAAKVGRVEHLMDVPVEVTFDGMTLSSWRILSEAL